MHTKRGHAILTVKSVDDEKRVITGVASTPTPDRVGDIVEPLGAKFALPMPLLWQHQHDTPVGEVTMAKATEDGIEFEARLAKIEEPGPLRDSIERAWQAVKARLVRGVSIGFSINAFEILKSGGWRITDWEWLELSVVTIPANSEATIEMVRSIDDAVLSSMSDRPPASGRSRARVTEVGGSSRVGVSAKSAATQVKAKEAKTMKRTIAEQISAFEATRAAKSARLDEIMEAAADEGVTLSAEQKEEYDTLEGEVKEIDEHLVRLRAREKTVVASAVAAPVDGTDLTAAGRVRAGVRVEVGKSQLPPGITFTRYAMALARAKGNLHSALEMYRCNKDWMSQSPEVETVLKAAVAAGTTTDSIWAAPLVEYQVMASEFAEYLRPLTIVGRIPGLRRVPFKVKVPRQTAAASVGWVGESKPKKVGSLAFDDVTLDHTKIAGIVAISMELARLSNPSAELLVRNDLAAGVVQFMDSQFVDPDVAAVATVNPASITNGVTPITATGTTYSYLVADVKNALQPFFTYNLPLGGIVVLMRQQLALSMSLMETSLGARQFPALTVNGGEWMGFPVVTSENVPYTEGSPQEGTPIIFINAPEILLADDGGVTIDVSTEASLQLNTTPDDPVTASSVLVSLWQQNLIGIRAERMVNWTKRRSQAVQMISAAKYA